MTVTTDYVFAKELAEKHELRIAELESALRAVVKMKAEPIGNSGFSVGPLAMFRNCRRLARSALRGANKLEQQ